MSFLVTTKLVVLSSASGTDSASLLPPSLQTVSAGDQFVAEIWVQSNNEDSGIAGGSISLKYPTSLLNATDFDQGSSFSFFQSGEINEEVGIISNIGGSSFDAGLGIVPEFIKFATVNFTAAESGEISLELVPGDNLFALQGEGNVSSDETEFHALILNQSASNIDPTGSVSITGTATQGEILTADPSAIADADGLGTFSYQWKADGTDISGATASTFELTQDQVGKAITVVASYTDGQGTAESLTSAATSSVTNVNDKPPGDASGVVFRTANRPSVLVA